MRLWQPYGFKGLWRGAGERCFKGVYQPREPLAFRNTEKTRFRWRGLATFQTKQLYFAPLSFLQGGLLLAALSRGLASRWLLSVGGWRTPMTSVASISLNGRVHASHPRRAWKPAVI